MVQRTVGGTDKQTCHRAVTGSHANSYREEASKQAERLPEAVRCDAHRSALRRPMQCTALANAAHCEKRSDEMRQVTQPVMPVHPSHLLIPHTGEETRRQTKGLTLTESISPVCIRIKCSEQTTTFTAQSAMQWPTCAIVSFRSYGLLRQRSELHTTPNRHFPTETADFIAQRTLSAHSISPS